MEGILMKQRFLTYILGGDRMQYAFTLTKVNSTNLAGKLWLTATILSLALAFPVSALCQQFPLDGRILEGGSVEDVLFVKTRQVAKNQEPAIFHESQKQEATAKLQALKNKTGKNPNIVVILMDDVGWGDIGANGGGAAIGAETPNIDLLAAQGLRLTSTYSQPSCTPTRATLLTGQLPIRTGLLRPTLPGEGGGGIGGAKTIAKILKANGYVTQAIGKWHLGQSKESQPQNVGFDNYYGQLTSSDDYTSYREPWRNPDIANDPNRRRWAEASEELAIVAGKTGEVAKPVFKIDMQSIQLVDEELTKHGVAFIESMKTSEKPFFLYFATRGTHFDNYPHPDFAGKSSAKYPYRDVVMELDYRIGQLVAALEKTGQLENTLIFITSDNGPMLETFPDMGYTPFRGGKGTTYEGGVRVPGIFHWKGMINPGRVSDGLFDMADFFTTAVHLAGATASIPTTQYIDGIDQTSFLLSNKGLSNRRSVFFWAGNVFTGMRFGEYKLVLNDINYQSQDTWPNRSPFQATVSPTVYGGKLFNLYMDPKEEHAMLPLKQPIVPLLLPEVARHIKTLKAFKPRATPRGLDALSAEASR